MAKVTPPTLLLCFGTIVDLLVHHRSVILYPKPQ